ncbi:dTDP-4-dehydrorhamnose reductase [Tamlana sp. s12]|uniref:dTDP-4-dehydrorhamnose reductase n=1 Tax=Tamlana sp. s12 TaxID=1630406 RepID=UPI0007FB9279|nr:dTDP-4-dehydrorhamnose reductase [Tamlana sp. s12]OBQ54928.1 dTDP-4-dehydrorhamnose reductase [Tamlana sp. s12]QQY83035.1 dTDP-4-dehydrorhamnose reductase [Tamlana sp. s12]
MNVLVTGSNGQLASCIKDLEDQYKELNFIYTDSTSLDICNLEQLKLFFKDNHILDYCINCAAYTAVDKAETEAEKAFQVNAEGAKNLALVCNENQVVLLHVSTDFVFDGNKTTPYTEVDTPNPISVYGASKLQGEVEIQKLTKECFIIRTSWLYSEHGNNFMKTMLRLAETRDEISVVSDQIGTPTYAGDLAEVLLHIINSKSTAFGLYHYSNEGEVSWFDFAKAIFNISNLDIKLNAITTTSYPTPAKRPEYSVLEKRKLISLFNLEIPNWKDSLLKILK